MNFWIWVRAGFWLRGVGCGSNAEGVGWSVVRGVQG